jgi:hypothetical protein
MGKGAAVLAHRPMTETERVAGEPPPPPVSRAAPRLTVDVARKTITLDGETDDVTSDAALRWVKVLAEHPGEWISAVELRKHDPELDSARTDRLKKLLPERVQHLIDSETGKGSRLRY